MRFFWYECYRCRQPADGQELTGVRPFRHPIDLLKLLLS